MEKRSVLPFVLVFAVLIISGGAGLVAADSAGNQTGPVEETRVVVQLAEIESFDSKADLQRQTRASQQPVVEYLQTVDGATVRDRLWISNLLLVTVDTDRVSLDHLRQHPDIERVEVDEQVTSPEPIRTFGTQSVPDDEMTYGLDQIDAPEAWESFETQGDGVTVGVIDSGINPDHVALTLNGGNSTNNYAGGWYTYYYPNGTWTGFDGLEGSAAPEPFDSDGHGTHVSGTIAGGNETGMAIGVAPDAELIHAAALYDGSGYRYNIRRSMEWMAEQEPDIVSMSLGSDTPANRSMQAIDTLRSLGIIVISSSGNSGEGHIGFPAGYETAIAVGATDSSRRVPYFSSGGEYSLETYDPTALRIGEWSDPQLTPYIVAPGQYVYSADYQRTSGLTSKSGTSMAAPHVSGIVALMLSNNPDLTPYQVEAVLRRGATEAVSVPDGRNTRSGYGIANAYNALALSNPGGFAAVDGVETNAPVEYGDTLVVTANISNRNIIGETATREISFSFNGTEVASQNVSIPSDGYETVRFDYETTEADTDVDRIVIETGDVINQTNVTIAEPPTFEPTIEPESVPEPFVVGDETTFNVSVTNLGQVPGTANLSLYVNGTLVEADGSNIPELDAGASTDIEFTYTAVEDDLPTINITAATDTNRTEYRADVAEPAAFEPTVNTTATDDLVAGETATIGVDVENVGGVAGTGSVDVFVNGTLVESGETRIPETAVGEQSTVNVSYAVTDADYPVVNVTARTATARSETLIDVLRPGESIATISSINRPLESEDIELEVDVHNRGDFPVDHTLTVGVDGLGSNATTVELAGRETTTVPLRIPTSVGDYGSYTLTASTPNSTDSLPVIVDRQATFDPEIRSINASVSAGETIVATVDVENIGNVSGTRTVSVTDRSTGSLVESTDLSLAAGANSTLSFSRPTAVSDIGEIALGFATDYKTVTESVSVTDPNPAELTAVEAEQDSEADAVVINGTITPGSLPIDEVSLGLEAEFTAYSTAANVSGDVSEGGTFSVEIPTSDLVGDGAYSPIGTVVDSVSHEVSAAGSAITVDTTSPELRLDTADLTTGSGRLLVEATEAFEITDIGIVADDDTDRSPTESAVPDGLHADTETVGIDFDSSPSGSDGMSRFTISVDAVDGNGNAITEMLNATVDSYRIVDGEGTVIPGDGSRITVRGNETELGGTVSRNATVGTSRTAPVGTDLAANQLSGGFLAVDDIGLSDAELENATVRIPVSDLDRNAISGFDRTELTMLKSDDGDATYREIDTEYNATTNELVAVVDGFSQFAAGGIDTTAPAVDAVDITPDTTVEADEGPVSITFEYSDRHSAINVSETSITAAVAASRYTTSITTTEAEVDIEGLTAGESITVTLSVADTAGNVATEDVTIEVAGGGETTTSTGGSSSGEAGAGGGSGGSGARSARPTPLPEDVRTLLRAKGRISGGENVSISEPGDFVTNPVIETVIFHEPNLAGELEVRDYSDMPSRAGRPPGTIISANEIMVPHAFENTPATLRFDLLKLQNPPVDLDELDRDTLTVWHGTDREWNALETRVIEDTDSGFIIEAETDGFSYFAVTDAPAEASERTQRTETGADSETEPTETEDETPGFGIVAACVALIVAGVVYRRRP